MKYSTLVMKKILFAVIASHRGRPIVGGIRREKSHMYWVRFE